MFAHSRPHPLLQAATTSLKVTASTAAHNSIGACSIVVITNNVLIASPVARYSTVTRCLCGRSERRSPPFRIPKTGVAQPAASDGTQRRGFRATASPRRQDLTKQNHYERLGVRHDAAPAEIKKSFYKLSKSHHPDTSRSPDASEVFSLLSESYHVLSNPSRRATYDRDTLRLHQQQASTPTRGGSYSSTQHHHQAGGRPASGLSRRRGTFRGPPPSFYRSGGWGNQAGKRRRAHDESTGGAENASSTSSAGSNASYDGAAGGGSSGQRAHDDPWVNASSSAQYGGMGPGSDPFGHRASEVPHFDERGHGRTQSKEDRKRWQRAQRAMGDDGLEFEPQMSLGGHFLVVSAILAVTVMAPMVYLNSIRSGRKKDGTTS